MTLNSTSDSSSIFKDGKLKPGIYKIQNLCSESYLDIHQHTREVCGRPAKDLGEGRGLWEAKPLGAGYTVQRVDPGKPEQFCAPMEGPDDGAYLCVTAYPVAWRVEVVNDGIHRGFEYVRFYWGLTKKTWDLPGEVKGNGTRVEFWDDGGSTWQTWGLIPVKVEGTITPSQSLSETLSSGSLPPYDRDATGESSAHTQHMESEGSDFGTIVTEVTTVTTCKRYRVEDA